MEPQIESSTPLDARQESNSANWMKPLSAFLLLPASLWLVRVSHSTKPSTGQYLWLVAILLVVTVSSFVVHVLLWFHVGSVVLGARSTISSSTKAVGEAFFLPAMAGTGLVILAKILFTVANGPELATTMRGAKLLIFLWALVSVVRQAKRMNAFSTAQVGMFVAWLIGLLGGALLVIRAVL